VIKISANAGTCAFLGEHIDVNVSGVVEKRQSLADAGEDVFERLLAFASGEPTKAELIGYTEMMDIFVRGPVI
jgi:(2R)-sulfolactate sulfo-lyase subunit beta